MLKKITVRLFLLSASTLVALAVTELGLRCFAPRYAYAATSKLGVDRLRIWANVPNAATQYRHPDSGIDHVVIYNNLAMRQHRDFTLSDLATATNIGFFGDSYTENLRVAAQYSFTEPLDYLLNLSHGRFNVLNFGVDGYGTDQSYLYYQGSPLAKQLHDVFYVLCANDLRNIYENNLFTSQNGVLHRNPPPQSPWWVRSASRLYLSYFLLDFRLRLRGVREIPLRQSLEYRYAEQRLSEQHGERFHSPRADAIERALAEQEQRADLESSIATFRAILKQWRQSVEANGAHFYVVLLPLPTEDLFTHIIDRDFNVISLYARFSSVIDSYNYDRDVKFRNDGHWNELGNLLAAVELYRVLERDLTLRTIPNENLKMALHTYYSVFPESWTPPPRWVTHVAVPPAVRSAIGNKYAALELESH